LTGTVPDELDVTARTTGGVIMGPVPPGEADLRGAVPPRICRH
jgi:hypothetical protein